jgi:hypothetical protein
VVTETAYEWLNQSEDEKDFRERKGFLKGHLQTRKLLDVLISQSEIGDKEWLEKEIAPLVQAARGILLGQDKGQVRERAAEQEEALDSLAMVRALMDGQRRPWTERV